MPNFGPNPPGTVANDATSGTIDWTGTGNVASDNGSYAQADLAFEEVAHILKGTNFGFGAIPDADTIGSITATARAFSASEFTLSDVMYLVVAGSPVGGGMGGAGTLPTTETDRIFLFTTGLPTTAQVKNIGFGCGYQLLDGVEPAIGSVDLVTMTVVTAEGAIIASGGWALGGAHSLSHRLIMLGGIAYGGTASLLLPAVEGVGGWAFGGTETHFMYLPMRGGLAFGGGDVGPGATAIVMQGGMAWGRPAFTNGFINRIKVTISPRATALYNFPLRVHMNFPTTAVRWEDLEGNKLTSKTAQFGPTYNGVVLVDIGTEDPTEVYLYWS